MPKRKTGQFLPCHHCGTKIYVRQYRIAEFKYCSRKCQGHAQFPEQPKRGTTAPCMQCGHPVYRVASKSNAPRYCSLACRNAHQKKAIPRKCAQCGKTFDCSRPRLATAKYCSIACSVTARMSHRPGTGIQAIKQSPILAAIKFCNRCDYSEHPEILVIHHRDRNRKNNALSNLEILCPNCHALEHYGNVECDGASNDSAIINAGLRGA